VNQESLQTSLGRWVVTGLLMAVSAGGAWFFARQQPKPPEVKTPTSSVGTVLKEADLTTISISDEARQKLQIREATIERRAMKRSRLYGGEVFAPPGQTMTVAAPLMGLIRAGSEPTPRPGQAVRKGQPILTLTPILSPDARANLAGSLVDAEGQVKTAKTQVEAAQIAWNRAQELYRQDAGSKRGVDETQALFDIARKNLDMVEARKTLFTKVVGEAETGAAHSIALGAPLDGILKDIHVAAGDTVPGNASLFVVTRLDPLWVRVPVYVGDIGSIDPAAAAAIVPLGDGSGKPIASARPVPAPPSATAAASSVDLYFELPNPALAFRPGQRLGVTLALKADDDNLTIPWSAVVHDIHGGSWVYEQLEPTKFVRRRVLLQRMQDGYAVLAEGPAVGTKIVVDGAEELFGIEVGFAK